MGRETITIRPAAHDKHGVRHCSAKCPEANLGGHVCRITGTRIVTSGLDATVCIPWCWALIEMTQKLVLESLEMPITSGPN